MAGTCTCGTYLVEDALFCHRCGKPQREIAVEPEERESPAPRIAHAEIAAPVQPVGFGNMIAVRVGFLAASVASMLDALPFVEPLFLLWSALAGFCSVVLYRRRTGQSLTVRSGAKMGLITGVLNGVIIIVFFTLSFVASMSTFPALFREQLSTMKAKDPASYAIASGILDNPYALATCLILLLFVMLFLATVAGIAGGALSAKVAKKG